MTTAAAPLSRALLTALAVTVAALTTIGCGPNPERAVIEMTDGGEIWIDLHPDLAPQTVANFKRLAREGFYDGTTFHLVIPGQMIQGGDPNTKNTNPADDGFGGPGYTIPDEFNDAKHVRGAVAMSRPNRPNSAGSQFYIMHADVGPRGEDWSKTLDGKYTIFGTVIAGMSVVDRIATTPTLTPADLAPPPDEDTPDTPNTEADADADPSVGAGTAAPAPPPAAQANLPFLESRPREPQIIATIRIVDASAPPPLDPDTPAGADPLDQG